MPVYNILEEKGPDHQKYFNVECETVLLEQNESASAGSKRKAEQEAATLTLEKIRLYMRCGNIAIIGRPNVGKSTFLNCVLEHKISITSRKPNTTRSAILGVYTKNDTQLLFIDTPGWQTAPKKLLNRHMNREVRDSLQDIDCVMMLADARGWRP